MDDRRFPVSPHDLNAIMTAVASCRALNLKVDEIHMPIERMSHIDETLRILGHQVLATETVGTEQFRIMHSAGQAIYDFRDF